MRVPVPIVWYGSTVNATVASSSMLFLNRLSDGYVLAHMGAAVGVHVCACSCHQLTCCTRHYCLCFLQQSFMRMLK
jgi:hypothetical protein